MRFVNPGAVVGVRREPARRFFHDEQKRVEEARFELGENAAESLHKGDAVIVVGKEHSNSWEDKEGGKQYGRVIDADTIGVDLSRATAAVTRNAKQE